MHRIPGRLMALALLAGLPLGVLSAQEPLPPDTTSVSASGLLVQTSPGGAFLRAVLVPGWGHASIGEHTRGGFYFLTETASAWMVVRTRARLGAAKAVRDLRREEVRARLTAQGVTDPRVIGSAESSDADVTAAEALVEARSQQFEDWLVLGIFLMFLSGADAFVTAHLQDFPEPVGFEFRPVAEGFQIGARVLLPRR